MAKNYKLVDIAGIGEERSQELEALGIKTVAQLLEAGATPKDRKELAEKLGGNVDTKAVLNWINRADLFRIKGISTVYSNLLEVAGVDTVAELAQRNAANLRAKMKEENERLNLSGRMPRPDEVESWVAQAKELPRAVHY